MFSYRARRGWGSEGELELELDAAAGRERGGGAAEADRFELAHGDAEVCAVEEVEDFGSEDEALRLAEAD